MKKGDYIVAVLAVMLALIPAGTRLIRRIQPEQVPTVTVEYRGTVLYSGPLSEECEIVTPDGGNTVSVRNGKAYMESAQCHDQLCVREGCAEQGKPVICLPNRVTVTVTGTGEAQYDAIVQ